MVTKTLSSDELKAKLDELRMEYDLARTGLTKGIFATGSAIVAGLISLGGGLYAFVKKGPGFLSGIHLVFIFAIMAAALVIYFAFVFGRTARVRAEINETKKLLEISAGEKVR